jgi:hypothetical protein
MPEIGYAFDRPNMQRVTRDLQFVESIAQSREGASYGSLTLGRYKIVFLVKVGGTDGDGTTAASWTYDVYADEAHTSLIASNVSPRRPREHATKNCNPAVEGWWGPVPGATDPSPQLIEAWESWGAKPCTPP